MECENNTLDNGEGIKLVAISGAISALLAEYLNLNDQNVIGNILCGIGQNLLIVAAQNSKYLSCIEELKDKDISKS